MSDGVDERIEQQHPDHAVLLRFLAAQELMPALHWSRDCCFTAQEQDALRAANAVLLGCSGDPKRLREHAIVICGLLARCRWIPVGERLPLDGELGDTRWALIARDGEVVQAVFERSLVDGRVRETWYVPDFGDVEPTHWMPLPEPPREVAP